MQRRNAISTVFVMVMLAAGALIVLRWVHTQRAAQAAIPWRKPTDVEMRLARSTISGQLHDFKIEDYDAAYRYLTAYSPDRPSFVFSFRAQMLSIPIFTEYKSYRFGDMQAQADGKALAATVLLKGRDGSVMRADYDLQLKNGSYRIEGFRPVGWVQAGDGSGIRPPSSVTASPLAVDAQMHAAVAPPVPPSLAQEEALAQSQAALAARATGTNEMRHAGHGDLH